MGVEEGSAAGTFIILCLGFPKAWVGTLFLPSTFSRSLLLPAFVNCVMRGSKGASCSALNRKKEQRERVWQVLLSSREPKQANMIRINYSGRKRRIIPQDCGDELPLRNGLEAAGLGSRDRIKWRMGRQPWTWDCLKKNRAVSPG